MGKTTGFMEFGRIEEGYRSVPERLKTYQEFVIGLDDTQAQQQAAIVISAHDRLVHWPNTLYLRMTKTKNRQASAASIRPVRRLAALRSSLRVMLLIPHARAMAPKAIKKLRTLRPRVLI